MTTPAKNPGATEGTDPLPLPGIATPPAGLAPIEVAARRTLAALDDLGLVDDRHALVMQLILDLSTVIGAACRKGQASAASMAAAQVFAGIELLMPTVEGGDEDDFDKLADELRAAAVDAARSAAAVRDST